MGKSDEFGRMISVIIGRRGLREAEKLTGISAAYIGAMKDGKVPSEEMIARFANGFGVTGELLQRLFDAGQAVTPELDPENILQFACDIAGLDTMQRYAVMETFRQQVEQAEQSRDDEAAA